MIQNKRILIKKFIGNTKIMRLTLIIILSNLLPFKNSKSSFLKNKNIKKIFRIEIIICNKIIPAPNPEKKLFLNITL